MADTWAARWAGSWAVGAQRFNMNHAPAGSATGGQFTGGGSGSNSSVKGGKAPRPAAGTHPASAAVTAHKAQLHAKASADRARARQLETQLHALEKQQAHAHAAAVKATATAKAAAKAANQKHPTAAKAAAA